MNKSEIVNNKNCILILLSTLSFYVATTGIVCCRNIIEYYRSRSIIVHVTLFVSRIFKL